MTKDLILPLKAEYFHAINVGMATQPDSHLGGSR